MKKNMSKMSKKLVAFAVAIVITMGSTGMASIALANNYTDTPFGYSYNGDGSDITTVMRAKLDSSATYVFNNATNSHSVSVAVTGAKTYSSSPSFMPSGYISTYYTVSVGNRKYITTGSNLYPTYSYAYLLMATSDHTENYISGKWSPDNISGY